MRSTLRAEAVGTRVQDAEEWQVAGDFKIQVFLDTISRSRSLFWCWHNTSFMSGTRTLLRREHLDKVHRSMPPGITLSLHWQPGQGTMFPLQKCAAALHSRKALLFESEALGAARRSGDSEGAPCRFAPLPPAPPFFLNQTLGPHAGFPFADPNRLGT